MKTCGFCKEPCGNDWCPTNQEVKEPIKEEECPDCDNKIIELEKEKTYLLKTINSLMEINRRFSSKE